MAKYINADELIENLNFSITMLEGENRGDLFAEGMVDGMIRAYKVVHGAVTKMPTADVRENVKGHWIPHPTIKNCHICSACTHEVISRNVNHEYAYCPKCGAIMDEGDE